MRTFSRILQRASVEPYAFEDDEKIVTFPTDINALAREERQLTAYAVEIDCELEKLRRQRSDVVERRNQIRERIADFARQHGCRSEPVTEVEE